MVATTTTTAYVQAIVLAQSAVVNAVVGYLLLNAGSTYSPRLNKDSFGNGNAGCLRPASVGVIVSSGTTLLKRVISKQCKHTAVTSFGVPSRKVTVLFVESSSLASFSIAVIVTNQPRTIIATAALGRDQNNSFVKKTFVCCVGTFAVVNYAHTN